jgi:hypothetical protein
MGTSKVRVLLLTAAVSVAAVLGGAGAVRALPDVAPGLGGNEPNQAAVNPLNPHNVAVTNCGVSVSSDFGVTFTAATSPTFPSPYTNFNCDDAVAYDSQGRLFWSYLLSRPGESYSVFVQQVNPTTGAKIGSPVNVSHTGDPSLPGSLSVFNDDKSWIIADSNPASPFKDNLYLVWTRLSTTQVMFSRSTDGGANWSTPRAVSAGGEGFVWPSHVAVAPNGDVYVAYHGDTCGSATASIFVLRDSTGGANLAAGTAVQKSSFQSAVTCNVQTSSTAIPGVAFWMQGANAPYVIPDPVRPGNIYVIANDDPDDNFSSGDPGDAIIARSTDYGNTWTKQTVSHGPAGTLQVYPTGAIDQLGNLMVFWYDTRGGTKNAGGHFLLDVYATVSRDGAQTFTNDFRINDKSFDPDVGAPCRFGCGGAGDPPPATLRIGEYNGAAAADGIGYAIWTGNTFSGTTPTGQQSIFDVFSITGQFPDRFEPNDSRDPGVATDLGAPDSISLPGLTIDSPTDEDFFRLQAHNTGSLRINMQSAGRVSDLDIQVQNSSGNPLQRQPARHVYGRRGFQRQ